MAPSVAVFHYHRGIGYARLGKHEEAKTSLLAAREKVSENDSLQSSIAEALADL